MKNILVTGGSGFIGNKLCAALIACGHHVAILTRDKSKRGGAARLLFGDLSIHGGLGSLDLTEFDVVIHCAGEIKSPRLMRDLHVEGTRQLLSLIRKRSFGKARELHWVQLSSVGAYGPASFATQDRHITERSAERPVGDYETTKTESDHLVMDAAERGDVTCSILRPSNVFGVGMPNQSLRALIRVVKRGIFFYIGQSGAVATYVHVDDVVVALTKCALDPRAKGQIYNLSSDCLLKDLIVRIANVLGVEPPWARVPEAMLRLLVRLLEGRIDIPLTDSRIDALVSRTRYSVGKIQAELNYQFLRPMPAAIDELVAECGFSLV